MVDRCTDTEEVDFSKLGWRACSTAAAATETSGQDPGETSTTEDTGQTFPTKRACQSSQAASHYF